MLMGLFYFLLYIVLRTPPFIILCFVAVVVANLCFVCASSFDRACFRATYPVVHINA